jgi:hypothetical protein
MLLYIIENIPQNNNMVPCFVEKIPKQHFKYVLYQNRICGFLLQVPTTPTLLKKLSISSSSLVIQNSHLLNYPKSHHHDQNNKNSKFKLTKFLDQSIS